MAATSTRLATIDVKGGLWGPDLLAALAEDRSKLPAETVTAESYDLPKRASTEQTARAAWTVLTAAWEEFTEHHQKRIAVFETPTYGADSFTWDKWTRHLLDQLGYDPEPTPAGGLRVDNADPDDPHDSYPISHTHHGQIPIHAVPAGVELDRRAAGVKGAARQSPHSLLQDYLNRTSRHLWGLVTNGLSLRLLRDNAALSRQAFIEFDLAAIFEEGAYADFALLWHAAHASRFTHDPDEPATACIAETWQEHATKTGVAALEDLRDGVEAAIAETGRGLIEHRDNTALREALADPDDLFDAPAFYRELLYIAYRHVFWFALDDRNLLHPDSADRTKVAAYRDHYASTFLRHKARSHLGARHPDGWAHFQTVAGWFADPDGCPELDIPGLLGRLWDPAATPHLNGTTLTNRRYYEALRRLGYVQRDGVLHRINYDAMGSEELGAVYESLLEIRPVADPAARTFTPDRTHGSERKETGSYYTPTPLIKVLLDEALDPVLEERLKEEVHGLPADATADARRVAEERALLGTTICDPAMGSAHFLVAAGMRVAKRLAAIRFDEVEPGPRAVHEAFRDVASRCLYGIDINPMAVELAKVAIWLECHVPGQPLTFLDHHLRCGNALVGVGGDWQSHRWRPGGREGSGIPDEAFTPGDGSGRAARALRQRNAQRRDGQLTLEQSAGWRDLDRQQLSKAGSILRTLDDSTPAGLATKEEAWRATTSSDEYLLEKVRCDAWMATWTVTKTAESAEEDHPLDVYYDAHYEVVDPGRFAMRIVADEASAHRFFHWDLEFPEIFEPDASGGFDVVLGNPPWIAHAGRAAQPVKAELKASFKWANPGFSGYPSTHGMFVVQAARLVRVGGRLGLVLPTSVADLDGYSQARLGHDELCSPVEPLTDFGDGAFEGVFQPCMALVSQRTKSGRTSRLGEVWTLSRPDLTESERRLLDRFSTAEPLPASLFAERGFQSDSKTKKLMMPITEEGPVDAVPLREGKDIREFAALPPRLKLSREILGNRASAAQQAEILIRQTARYPIAAPNDGTAFRNSLIAGVPDDTWDRDVILGVLNSSFIRWLHYQRYRDARQGMPQMKLGHLRSIPAPRSDTEPALDELRRIAERCIAAKGVSPEDRRALDAVIARLYELTESESNIVAEWIRSEFDEDQDD